MRRKGPKAGFKKEGETEIVTLTKYFICSLTESWTEVIKQVITRVCGKYSIVVKRWRVISLEDRVISHPNENTTQSERDSVSNYAGQQVYT